MEPSREDPFDRAFDWTGTGKGNHVEFAPDETVPLQVGRQLGRGAQGDVHEARCQGTAVAVKRRRLSRKTEFRPFKKEMKNLQRVSGHRHIIKIVGSFVQDRIIGIILWPVAVCDLGNVLSDYDTLFASLPDPYHVHQDEVVSALGRDGWTELEALDAISASNNTVSPCHTSQCPGKYKIQPGLKRLWTSFGCLAGALVYIHGKKIKQGFKAVEHPTHPRKYLYHGLRNFHGFFGPKRSSSIA